MQNINLNILLVLSIISVDIMAHSVSKRESKIRKCINLSRTWTTSCGKFIIFFFKLANYLKICHRKDPKLNECVQESIEKLRPSLAQGVKELLLPSCEPLEIPHISISQNAGAISMESMYSNILVHGLTNFTLHGVR